MSQSDIRKIIVAPDSFKGSLSALQVARAIRTGLTRVDSQLEIEIVPMADGGEGTVDAMVQATGGQLFTQTVTGPLGHPTQARWALLGDRGTAVIEMAAASGLTLVPPAKRNPMLATTYGTGELIKAALDHCDLTQLIIGAGGSATVDGGCGAAQALGIKLLDRCGGQISRGGGGLEHLARIDASGADPRLKRVPILVACDVDNPLTGSRGAAKVFGPQKGATPKMVEQLEQNLCHLAQIISQQLGTDIQALPAAGAAGGLAGGLAGFFGAKLQSGSELIIQALDLERRIAQAQLCITGEGRLDDQTLGGKTVYSVAKLANKYGIATIAIVGTASPTASRIIPPLTAYFSILDQPMQQEQAFQQAEQLLANTAEQVMRLLKLS